MVAPVTWSPKDPDETINYELDWETTGLASGDALTGSEWVDVTGVTVAAFSISTDGLRTVAVIAGGTDGTTAYLLNRVTTANGETLEQPVLLPIVANVAPVVLAEYDKPTPAHLIAIYPAFAAVSYLTIQTYLTAAEQGVDESWLQPDYAPALMALAAHNMALLNIGAHGEAAGYAQAGLTRIRSGNFDASFSEAVVGKAAAGGMDATPYGRIYKTMLRRSKGGPRIAAGPAVASDIYPPTWPC